MSKLDTGKFLDFLNASPTPFHATREMIGLLDESGYLKLDESESWSLKPGNKYWVSRNDSSLIAFQLPASPVIETGLTLIGAHTDSPCLKLKPLPEKNSEDYFQTGVEVYGGALLNPWFDRDLSLAGRISYADNNDRLKCGLINLMQPVAVIPSLAIHLDREVNKQRCINAQLHLPPLWFQQKKNKGDFRELLKKIVKKQSLLKGVSKILDFDLYYYDTQAAAITGLNHEFIAGARLDNLLSCYVGLQSLLNAAPSKGALLVCTDHEEIGSQSACGANGPFLRNVLQRIGQNEENTQRLIHHSILISVDNAHAVHPNFADKHDPQHKPQLNQGPVIKVNANQRYATNSQTAAWFRHVCQNNAIPVQTIAVRSDMACGSTIGPITAANVGLKTVDVGVAQLAMHSIRELAGKRDIQYLYDALSAAINM